MKKLLAWDAYKFVDQFVDDEDWATSFLFTNEKQTLEQDIDKFIMKGKMVIFGLLDGDRREALCCYGPAQFIDEVIVDLRSDFIIYEKDDGVLKIEVMSADLVPSTIYLYPKSTGERNGI